MTAIVSHSPTTHWVTRLAPIAGITFVAAWAVGLAVRPSGPAIDATGTELARHYADHAAAAAVQSLLVHGVAAIALATVALAVARTAHTSAPRAAHVVSVAGVTAAVLSAAQLVAGLLAALTVVAADSERASGLFAVVTRVDGLKMLDMAVMAAAGVVLSRRRLLPPRFGRIGVVLTASLVAAGIGYLAMSPTLGLAAAPALLLLLVWVCDGGITAGRG